VTTEDGQKVVRRFWEEVFAQSDFEAMDDMFAASFELHNLVYAETSNLDQLKEIIQHIHRCIPGTQVVVEDLKLAGNDRVYTRFTVQVPPPQDADASQQDVPPSGGWEYSGMSMSRVAGGKIEESWIVWEAIRAKQELDPFFSGPEWRWPPWR